MIRPAPAHLTPASANPLAAVALRRLEAARRKTLASLGAGAQTPQQTLHHGLIALMQFHAEKRRLLLSYDAAELAEIIGRIGPKGAPLPLPR